MSATREDRSVSDLVSHALEQVSALFRSEVDLAKAEMSKKAAAASSALAVVAVGAVFAMATTVMLLIAAMELLRAAGMGPALSAVVATLLGGAVAAALVVVGLGRLRGISAAPERTMRQVSLDAEAAKGMRT